MSIVKPISEKKYTFTTETESILLSITLYFYKLRRRLPCSHFGYQILAIYQVPFDRGACLFKKHIVSTRYSDDIPHSANIRTTNEIGKSMKIV